LLFATNENSIPSTSQKLPGGRAMASRSGCHRHGAGRAIVSLFVNTGGRKFLVASHEGQGFVVNEDDCSATPARAAGAQCRRCRRGEGAGNGHWRHRRGDRTNHKMVVFPIDQVPEMARGPRGVRLQKYKGGGLSGCGDL